METALKQRLVGAAVLVALAVIFLPMLVKGPAPESGISDVPLKLPEAPQGEFETRELPLVTPSAAPAEGVTGTRTVPEPAATLPEGMLPAATAGGDYAVSFGSYASSADAKRVVDALVASQLPGYQEAVPASGGRTLYRVRIGPFATQADAEAARLRAAHVRDDVGAKVVVLDAASAGPAATAAVTPAAPAASGASVSVPQPLATTAVAKPAPLPAATPAAPVNKPTVPASVNAPAATTVKPAAVPAAAPRPGAAGVGFAVQLGAFGKAEDANALRERARAVGFSAFVEQVKTDKGTLSRVRVGPVADRAEADALRAQVASKLGVSGIVRPHP